MQEGRLYRVVDRLNHAPSVQRHGWLWVLVDLGSREYGNELGAFRSVATGHILVIHFGAVEELSDAGG